MAYFDVEYLGVKILVMVIGTPKDVDPKDCIDCPFITNCLPTLHGIVTRRANEELKPLVACETFYGNPYKRIITDSIEGEDYNYTNPSSLIDCPHRK